MGERLWWSKAGRAQGRLEILSTHVAIGWLGRAQREHHHTEAKLRGSCAIRAGVVWPGSS